MNAEDTDQPRAWNDNHPWLHYGCTAIDDDERLLLRGEKIEIRWVFQMENFKAAMDNEIFSRGLAYDRAGNFYGIIEHNPGRNPRAEHPVRLLLQRAGADGVRDRAVTHVGVR